MDALIIQTKSGNMIQDPLFGVANKAMADFMRNMTEFGITPTARTRIVADGNGDDDDLTARFFNRSRYVPAARICTT
jgi:phage terminase small subunit